MKQWKPSRRRPYPWGTKHPRRRLKLCARRVRTHLDSIAAARDYRRVQALLPQAISSTSELIETMQYISRNGLASGKSGNGILPHNEVDHAVNTVLREANRLANSSIVEFSSSWTAFSESLKHLLACSGNASRHGVTPSLRYDRNTVWEPFCQ